MKIKNSLGISTAFILSSMSLGVFAGNVTVNFNTQYQEIDGFGGMNAPGWINDLTSAQATKAFGTGNGEMGLSIMRMRIDPDSNQWNKQVPIAQIAYSYGAKLLATPWTPPAYMKDNNSLKNGGKLKTEHYWGYTNHLMDFTSYMAGKSAPIYALSLQNEPDWHPDYESCDWSGADFVAYLNDQGWRLDPALKIVAPESLRFNTAYSDPILNNNVANSYVDIIGGHLYGATPKNYPLALQKGKKLWMTEHYTNTEDANNWNEAINVGLEIHQSMVANYSAYIWWYIRRSYGLLTEDGNVSKRGYIMSQFSKFVRPGYVRIAATETPESNVYVTAYKNSSGKLVIVVVNKTNSHKQLNFTLRNGTVSSMTKYSTSASMNMDYRGNYSVSNNQFTAYADPWAVQTFVSN
ncbi:glycoside hydrolase family 30 beta sandwich domain-containing protein [Vibrio mangrovi]|uniref:Glucuronoxylanase XynC n=1 Tax=Vibrio mangrovi TaxID=474394 RepID=A0A1Y6ITE6_9VIBR|nr:glycoside hydrolase family 30 beta sandwich domain-containing protein [Vibrio mangrovi]MDW6004647.1 glycoside hydrolase family 30 beta sandwich domain-containing protein [Vibrio mangrovi]SMS00937.1 Glucuronoxylanase XynC precursor [Vibrio mangrovi]